MRFGELRRQLSRLYAEGVEDDAVVYAGVMDDSNEYTDQYMDKVEVWRDPEGKCHLYFKTETI